MLGPMRMPIGIREFQSGDEPALFEVYFSAIHLVARRDYSKEQLNAWAPADLDQVLWASKMHSIKPFVAELDGEIVGYADLQNTGYIDHFFVSGSHQRKGIGKALMKAIFTKANALTLHELTSDVSRTAQAFFERFGFTVVEERFPIVRGIEVPNTLMRKSL